MFKSNKSNAFYIYQVIIVGYHIFIIHLSYALLYTTVTLLQ